MLIAWLIQLCISLVVCIEGRYLSAVILPRAWYAGHQYAALYMPCNVVMHDSKSALLSLHSMSLGSGAACRLCNNYEHTGGSLHLCSDVACIGSMLCFHFCTTRCPCSVPTVACYISIEVVHAGGEHVHSRASAAVTGTRCQLPRPKQVSTGGHSLEIHSSRGWLATCRRHRCQSPHGISLLVAVSLLYGIIFQRISASRVMHTLQATCRLYCSNIQCQLCGRSLSVVSTACFPCLLASCTGLGRCLRSLQSAQLASTGLPGMDAQDQTAHQSAMHMHLVVQQCNK